MLRNGGSVHNVFSCFVNFSDFLLCILVNHVIRETCQVNENSGYYLLACLTTLVFLLPWYLI